MAPKKRIVRLTVTTTPELEEEVVRSLKHKANQLMIQEPEDVQCEVTVSEPGLSLGGRPPSFWRAP